MPSGQRPQPGWVNDSAHVINSSVLEISWLEKGILLCLLPRRESLSHEIFKDCCSLGWYSLSIYSLPFIMMITMIPDSGDTFFFFFARHG